MTVITNQQIPPTTPQVVCSDPGVYYGLVTHYTNSWCRYRQSVKHWTWTPHAHSCFITLTFLHHVALVININALEINHIYQRATEETQLNESNTTTISYNMLYQYDRCREQHSSR
jgi:hypothetical protein